MISVPEFRFSEASVGLPPGPDSLLPFSAQADSAEAACWVVSFKGPEEQKTGFPPASSVRVLHVINGQYYAGAERVQDLLAQYLPDCGFQVGFALLKPGQFVRQRRCQKAPVWPVPMRNRLDIRPAWRLARLIRQEGYRLVHAHTPRSLLVGAVAAWLAGVPLVYHVHSPAWADSTRWFFNWANAALEQLLLRRAKRVICVSGALADQMHRRGLPKPKLAVVPNGVPTPSVQWQPKDCFRSVPAPREPASTEQDAQASGSLPALPDAGFTDPALPAAACPWTIGTVALFRPRKGIEILLEALALLNRRGVPVCLRAVGPFESSTYQEAVLQKVRQLGLSDRVQWPGPVENVEAELRNMDMFVLPSLFGEGLPMVLLEAMALGMPIIASQIPGIDEVIRPGQEGLLAPPGQPQALAQAIGQLMSHPEEAARLAHQARQRHLQCYSAQAMARGVAQVYREVLGDNFPAATWGSETIRVS